MFSPTFSPMKRVWKSFITFPVISSGGNFFFSSSWSTSCMIYS